MGTPIQPLSYPSNSQLMLFVHFFAEASVQNFHTFSDLIFIIPIFPEKYAFCINLNVFVQVSVSQMFTHHPAQIKCIEYYQNNVISFIFLM